MSWTEKDYDEALNRRAAGSATDDDERLIGLYEQEHAKAPHVAEQDPPATVGNPTEDGDVPMQFTTSATAEVIPDEPNADEQDNDAAGKPARTARGKNAR